MKEETVPADTAVIDKVWSDAQTVSLKRGREMEVTRRAEAEKKVVALCHIPPERVQDWIDGKLSEEELEKVVALAQKTPTKVDITMQSPRVSRFAMLSVATLFLALLYGTQRRRAQTASIKKARDQNSRESPKAEVAHRTWTINN